MIVTSDNLDSISFVLDNSCHTFSFGAILIVLDKFVEICSLRDIKDSFSLLSVYA